jgi:hypothetical protein
MASTATVADNSNTTANSIPVSRSNEVYRAYVKLDENGKIVQKETRVVSAGKENATWNELDKPKAENGGYEPFAIEQTFTMYKVGSVAAAVALFDNDDELVNVINQGLAAKVNRKINAALREVTDDGTNLVFEPVTTVDTIDYIQEETRRKNLTPLEKAQRQFKTVIKSMYPTESEEFIEQKVMELLSAAQG